MTPDLEVHLLGLLFVDRPDSAAGLAAKALITLDRCQARLQRMLDSDWIERDPAGFYKISSKGAGVLQNRPRSLPFPSPLAASPEQRGMRKPVGSDRAVGTKKKRKLIYVKTLTAVQAVTIHEQLRAAVAAGYTFAWTRLIVLGLATFAGLRAGEIVGLNLSDLEITGRADPVVRVRREITKSKAGVREVPADWNRRFLEDLRRYLAWRFGDDWADRLDELGDEPVVVSERSRTVLPPGGGQGLFDFVRPNAGLEQNTLHRPAITAGGRIDRDTARKHFRTAVAAVFDLKAYRVTTHTGRHTFCSLALAAGRTVAQVKDAAGHSNIAITSTYLHGLRSAGDEDCFGKMYAAAGGTR